MYSMNTICDDILLHIFSFLFDEKSSYFCSSSSFPYLNMYLVEKHWHHILKKKECVWSKIAYNHKVYCYCSYSYEHKFITHFKTHCSWIENHYREKYRTSLHPTLHPSSYNKKFSETRVYSFHNYIYNDYHKMDTTKIRSIFEGSNVDISHFCCDDTGFMFRLKHETDLEEMNED